MKVTGAFVFLILGLWSHSALGQIFDRFTAYGEVQKSQFMDSTNKINSLPLFRDSVVKEFQMRVENGIMKPINELKSTLDQFAKGFDSNPGFQSLKACLNTLTTQLSGVIPGYIAKLQAAYMVAKDRMEVETGTAVALLRSQVAGVVKHAVCQSTNQPRFMKFTNRLAEKIGACVTREVQSISLKTQANRGQSQPLQDLIGNTAARCRQCAAREDDVCVNMAFNTAAASCKPAVDKYAEIFGQYDTTEFESCVKNHADTFVSNVQEFRATYTACLNAADDQTTTSTTTTTATPSTTCTKTDRTEGSKPPKSERTTVSAQNKKTEGTEGTKLDRTTVSGQTKKTEGTEGTKSDRTTVSGQTKKTEGTEGTKSDRTTVSGQTKTTKAPKTTTPRTTKTKKTNKTTASTASTQTTAKQRPNNNKNNKNNKNKNNKGVLKSNRKGKQNLRNNGQNNRKGKQNLKNNGRNNRKGKGKGKGKNNKKGKGKGRGRWNRKQQNVDETPEEIPEETPEETPEVNPEESSEETPENPDEDNNDSGSEENNSPGSDEDD